MKNHWESIGKLTEYRRLKTLVGARSRQFREESRSCHSPAFLGLHHCHQDAQILSAKLDCIIPEFSALSLGLYFVSGKQSSPLTSLHFTPQSKDATPEQEHLFLYSPEPAARASLSVSEPVLNKYTGFYDYICFAFLKIMSPPQ